MPFTRPDSPPPRQPSPDLPPAPLPSPHLRARLRHSASKQSLPTYSPSLPPGLSLLPHSHKPISSMRSYDHIATRSRFGTDEEYDRRRTRSTLTASPPTTPRSLPMPSSPRGSDQRPHRRCLSSAIPYRSPPPSPTISSAPPPVPPIPAFVLTPPTGIKSPPRPQPKSITPIRLPELDHLPPLSESTYRSQKQSRPLAASAPSPEKHRSVGMTCLKFFSMRNSRQRSARTMVDT